MVWLKSLHQGSEVEQKLTDCWNSDKGFRCYHQPGHSFYVVLFMAMILAISLIISTYRILQRNLKELLIDVK